MPTHSELRNLTTATKDNALTAEERDEFLRRKLVARLASNRGDGWWHVTPIWYVWENERLYLSLGNSRRHLKNMQRDPHVTLCVDIDPRLDDPSRSPRSVVCFGMAELLTDEATVRAISGKVGARYMGGVPSALEDALWFEGRTAVAIIPVRWLAWDQGKGV